MIHLAIYQLLCGSVSKHPELLHNGQETPLFEKADTSP